MLTQKQTPFLSLFVRLAALLAVTGIGMCLPPQPAREQQSAPLNKLLQNQDLFPVLPGERLEVERVELTRFGAVPAEIHRSPGKFILLLVNHSSDPRPSFLLDSSEALPNPLTGILSHLLQLDGSKTDAQRRLLATVVQAPAGEFDLKSASTGKILCKFKFQ